MLRHATFLLMIATGSIAAVPATAQVTDANGATAGDSIAEPQAAVPAFQSSGAVDDGVLQAIAGREDIGVQIANANQRNTVANNSVNGNSVTGSIAIDGNAFQNLQGLAVINANSGNNVAINSAMNVTINLAPMP